MTKDEIMSFVNANPTCYLATVEGDVPHVRAMGMYKADERGILIQLSSVKDMYQQLVNNPKVELCFNGSGKQVRVNGRAEFLETKEIKEEVLKARPFLKGLVDEKGLDVIKIFRVADATATVWTMATNFAPKDYITL
jgi:uncharacterized pyridoxamine 5'-phosphate oxidase family protein